MYKLKNQRLTTDLLHADDMSPEPQYGILRMLNHSTISDKFASLVALRYAIVFESYSKEMLCIPVVFLHLSSAFIFNILDINVLYGMV